MRSTRPDRLQACAAIQLDKSAGEIGVGFSVTYAQLLSKRHAAEAADLSARAARALNPLESERLRALSSLATLSSERAACLRSTSSVRPVAASETSVRGTH